MKWKLHTHLVLAGWRRAPARSSTSTETYRISCAEQAYPRRQLGFITPRRVTLELFCISARCSLSSWAPGAWWRNAANQVEWRLLRQQCPVLEDNGLVCTPVLRYYVSRFTMTTKRKSAKLQLRRSISEQLRDSTSKAWDLLWRNVRERRLAGQYPTESCGIPAVCSDLGRLLPSICKCNMTWKRRSLFCLWNPNSAFIGEGQTSHRYLSVAELRDGEDSTSALFSISETQDGRSNT